jgi:hypothetical protein
MSSQHHRARKQPPRTLPMHNKQWVLLARQSGECHAALNYSKSA